MDRTLSRNALFASISAIIFGLAICPIAMADAEQSDFFYETIGGQAIRFMVKDTEPGTTPAGTEVAGHVIYMGLSEDSKISDPHISIPESVTHDGITYGINRIGQFAFAQNTALTSITIPEGVEKIHNSAFRGCSSLESVSLPKSMTYVGTWAFKDCTKLKNIDLSNLELGIGAGAFMHCKSLTSVKLSDNLKMISLRAFLGSGLESVSANPRYLTNGAFSYCSSLKMATVGSRVEAVYLGYAFRESKNLKIVTIKSGKLNKKRARALLRGSYVTTVKVPKKLVSRYKAYYAKPIKSSIKGVRTVKVKVKAL